MKVYIANDTCSRAAQLVANEPGVELQLVHFDVHNKSTSNDEDFAAINPLLYVLIHVLPRSSPLRRE
jgi:glutathione S-transferase